MELYHHGIKGQKWGVQNGPPYPLVVSGGSRRFRTDLDQKDRARVKASAKQMGNHAATIGRVTSNVQNRKVRGKKFEEARTMTDAQLREYVNRMNLEQQYVNLSSNYVNSGKIQAREVLEVSGALMGIAAGAATVYTILKAV